jgi:hypothetical protein
VWQGPETSRNIRRFERAVASAPTSAHDRGRESHAVIAGIAGPDAQARIGTLQRIAIALQPAVTAMQPPASLLARRRSARARAARSATRDATTALLSPEIR